MALCQGLLPTSMCVEGLCKKCKTGFLQYIFRVGEKIILLLTIFLKISIDVLNDVFKFDIWTDIICILKIS